MTPEQLNALRNKANDFPSAFIDVWCIDNKQDRLKLMAAARSKKRMELIVAVKLKFPRLTAVRCSKLFHGLDHSTIIYAWNKFNVPRRKRDGSCGTTKNLTPEQRERNNKRSKINTDVRREERRKLREAIEAERAKVYGK